MKMTLIAAVLLICLTVGLSSKEYPGWNWNTYHGNRLGTYLGHTEDRYNDGEKEYLVLRIKCAHSDQVCFGIHGNTLTINAGQEHVELHPESDPDYEEHEVIGTR
jgi:hypothetical protein